MGPYSKVALFAGRIGYDPYSFILSSTAPEDVFKVSVIDRDRSTGRLREPRKLKKPRFVQTKGSNERLNEFLTRFSCS